MVELFLSCVLSLSSVEVRNGTELEVMMDAGGERREKVYVMAT
jgi:hypothetical protein